MTMKMKFFVLLSVCVMLLASTSAVYAASGDGYFGDDEVIDANPEPTTDSTKPFIPPMPDEEELMDDEDETTTTISSTKKSDWKKPPEKYADDATKVIKSYGLNKAQTNTLISRHKDAVAGMGNREKVDRYSSILKKYPMDYFAAYKAAEANFAMGRNNQALQWVNRSLKIYPDYMPARRLKKQIQGALK